MTLDIMDGELWQWDTGREVEAAGCEQVHFAKSTAGTCYTVEVAGNKAKIPDELLQAAGRVYAWAYITDEAYGGRTRIEALWDVKRRAKPAEYVYEPSDQRTIKDAETARDEAKAAQKAAEAARDRAVAAEVKGARATTLAPGSEATAAMEGNVLEIGVPKGERGDCDFATFTVEDGTLYAHYTAETPNIVFNLDESGNLEVGLKDD